MAEVKMLICPGVCGFQADLNAVDEDGTLTFQVNTSCDKVKAFIAKLAGADTFTVAFTPLPENLVAQCAKAAGLHTACPMPMAVIKAAEVCGGLALPRDIEVRFV